MDGKSLNITQENINQLKQIFPQIFKEGKVDFLQLKALLGEDVIAKDEAYGLTWAGKYEAFKEMQKQTTATLIPDREGSIDFDNAENIFIEGENLEVLRVLQKSYYGKIKMIYIDPPYNTGNDSFVYPDDYTERREDYEKRAGITNAEGFLNKQDLWKKNTKENGQFHSVWLSMMYPRLYLAKNLLKEDGLILVSIDDNEAFNLKLLLDEIFGEENYIGEFIWINRTTPNDSGIRFASDHEFIFVYSKNKEYSTFKGNVKDLTNYKNPDNDINGEWIADNPSAASGNESYRFPIINPYTNETYYPPKGRFWAFSPKRVDEWFKSGKLVFPKEPNKNFLLKKYLKELKSDFKPISSIIQGIFTSNGTKELKSIFPEGSPFKYPKPSILLKLLLEQITDNDDIILDFFAGSGTTAHAVLELNFEKQTNRKFICVQLDEKYSPEDESYKSDFKFVSDVTKARIKKISELYSIKNKEKIINSIANFGVKSFKLVNSNFKQWSTNIEDDAALLNQLDLFKNPVSETFNDFSIIYELVLKTGFQLNAIINKITFNNNTLYVVNNNQLIISINSISNEVIDEVIKRRPNTFICLDSLFNNDDQLKTNASLQFAEYKIKFLPI